MRYGQPAVGTQLQALLDAGVQRVLVLALYPQYSAATTASLFDGVADWVRRSSRYPELRFVNDYHDHPDYIAALAGSVRAHCEGKRQRAQHLVMSFHAFPSATRGWATLMPTSVATQLVFWRRRYNCSPSNTR